ncbi:hypothetical protein L9F63_027642, partial [Diploptera punctata]
MPLNKITNATSHNLQLPITANLISSGGRMTKLCLLLHLTSHKAVYTASVPLPSVNNCTYSLNGVDVAKLIITGWLGRLQLTTMYLL